MTVSTQTFDRPYVVFKVEYSDPAGSFAGWFIHTVETASYVNPFAGSPSSELSTAIGTTGAKEPITSRLASMFGPNRSVWTATLVVTSPAKPIDPPVFDTTFGDDA
jgi:hypothetical protein